MERVRSWLGDDDWEALGQAAHYARANLAKVVGRVPGALGTLLDVVGDLGLEDAGRLGAAIAKVASLLEEGDLQALEDTIGEILEAGWLISSNLYLWVTYCVFQDSLGSPSFCQISSS